MKGYRLYTDFSSIGAHVFPLCRLLFELEQGFGKSNSKADRREIIWDDRLAIWGLCVGVSRIGEDFWGIISEMLQTSTVPWTTG